MSLKQSGSPTFLFVFRTRYRFAEPKQPYTDQLDPDRAVSTRHSSQSILRLGLVAHRMADVLVYNSKKIV
jgi:hypothetical protein